MTPDGKKVIIIGANGRMGAALVRRYEPLHQVIPWKRADLDVLHPERVRPALADLDFDVIIYAAGLTNVDYCEDHSDECMASNATTPEKLAEACAEKGARLIHVSTDYVFDGISPVPRTETEVPHPICEYGRAKYAGEQAVLAVSPDFLVLRVSWLFGPDKPSFPDMIINRAMASDTVEAIADKVSCPTYSEDLAEWIEPMITDSRYKGLLHLCNQGSSTWQNYGQVTLDIAHRLGVPLKARTVDGVSRLDFPAFKAARPEFTAFDTTKYEQIAGHKTRPWEEAIEAYLRLKYVGA